jgi:hypothetical protein
VITIWLQHVHQVGPSSRLEYVIAGIAVVVAAYAMFLAVKYTIRPGEQEADHIKRRILSETFGLPEKDQAKNERR